MLGQTFFDGLGIIILTIGPTLLRTPYFFTSGLGG